MDSLSYKTISANKETVTKEWVIIDATDQVLGRMASKAASMLRGKNKTNFTPHADCGDNVIIVNAEKVRMTGNKWTDREHYSHTGYPGGEKRTTPEDIARKDPARLVEMAISRMLPKNRLGSQIFHNLHVYAGPDHPHEAQKPKAVKP